MNKCNSCAQPYHDERGFIRCRINGLVIGLHTSIGCKSHVDGKPVKCQPCSFRSAGEVTPNARNKGRAALSRVPLD